MAVLLLIGLGMIKFGVAMGNYVVLTNAASQGATALALSRGTTSPYTTTTTAVTIGIIGIGSPSNRSAVHSQTLPAMS